MSVLVLMLINEYLFKVIIVETVTTKLLICRHSWQAIEALYGLWGLGRAEVQNCPMFLQTLQLLQGGGLAFTLKMAISVFSIKVFIHLHSYILKVNQSFATNMF